jgi:phosphatidylserine/phosphatidylglycerophosphate/cardiolipin synthase-like enzyme
MCYKGSVKTLKHRLTHSPVNLALSLVLLAMGTSLLPSAKAAEAPWVFSPFRSPSDPALIRQKWLDEPMRVWMEKMTREKTTYHNEVEFFDKASDYYGKRLSMIRSTHGGDTLDLQTFWFCDDVAGMEIARELASAAGRGVRVRVIIDNVTSIYSPRDHILTVMRTAGVEVADFNPTYWGLDAINSVRAHEKVMIVNGAQALVGGANLCDVYQKGQNEKLWQDFEMYVAGPAAARVQARFDETYNFVSDSEAQARYGLETALLDPSTRSRSFRSTTHYNEPTPSLAIDEGDAQVLYDYPQPYLRRSDVASREALYPAMVNRAKKSVTIYMPYLLPRPDFKEALFNAVKRGVRVSLMTNSMKTNDNGRFISLRAFSHYPELTSHGVEVYEISDTVLHGKAMLIDDLLLMVGSNNMDHRSILSQGEASLMTGDQEAIRKFTAMSDRHRLTYHKVGPAETAQGKELNFTDQVLTFGSGLFEELY